MRDGPRLFLPGIACLVILWAGCAIVPSPPAEPPPMPPAEARPAENLPPIETWEAPPPLAYVPEPVVPAPPSAAAPPQTAEPDRPPVTASIPPGLEALADTRSAGFLTRARLAELLVSAGASNRGGPVSAPIMSDIVGHPAQEQIIRLVALGIMDAFPSHQFKPEAVVTRAELADSLQRVLRRRGILTTAPAHELTIPDVPSTNRYRDQIHAVVGAGLMTVAPGSGFDPARPASGREAWEAVVRLNALLAGLRG